MNKSLRSVYSCRKLFSASIICLFFAGGSLNAQPWDYNFGTATGTYNTPGSTTAFLPSASSGTARINIGNSGSFALANPGSPMGSGSELQCFASTNSTIDKFAVYGYTQGTTAYMKFKIRFESATAGSYYYYIGDGTSFSDDGTVQTSEAFTGIKWTIDNAGNIAAALHQSSGWLPFASGSFTQNTNYTIEIFLNNYFEPEFYNKNGGYMVYDNKLDVWVNGAMVMDDVDKLSLPNMSSVNSWMFYSQNANSGAVMILDDIRYANDITQKNIVLPLGLNVKAWSGPRGIQLGWEYENEQDVDSYTIERSDNGASFISIGEMNLSSSGSAGSPYQFTDIRPLKGLNFYRLRINDRNGKKLFSDIVRMNNNGNEADIHFYPNPVLSKRLSIEFDNLPEGSYTLSIVDAVQKEAFKKTILHAGGSRSETIGLPYSMPKGIYQVYVSSGSMHFYKTIMVD